MAFVLESSSIADGRPIPEAHAVATPTTDGRAEIAGADRSPHLRWSGEPDGTRSFAVSVVDPDVPADRTRMGVEDLVLGDEEPRVDFAHWLLVDIPSGVHEIAEGDGGDGFVPHGRPPGRTPFGGVEGQNGYRGLFEGNADLEGTYGGWDGPFPPWNDEIVHRYRVTVHALDVASVGLEPGFTLDAFREAIDGHVLAEATLEPTYTLNPSLRDAT
ncbi:MAG TPA: YbhB/YbcL family Raf kinase inhibitor-like protein [Actinomycetota bacterium]|nr:YbhB/YbcL family Raf kinase inhibitor-like protein [Actinomycetota bacterium]